MTEQQARQKAVETAKAWLGAVQGDANHKWIIDIYNGHSPRPRGYKVTYTDAWCASFVSFVGIKLGWTDIMPPECGCGEMIKLYQQHPHSKWEERDDYVPQIGDIIMYDWDDSAANYATTDNTGWPEHVGMVSAVSGNNLTIIEGNYSKSVKERQMKVNGRYIRGYCLPAYHLKADGVDEPVTVAPTPTPVTRPTLRNGDWSDAVKTLQTRLNVHGAKPQLTVDGGFGKLTETAVRAFQADKKLLVDGVVGAATWVELDKEPQSAAQPPATVTPPATTTPGGGAKEWAVQKGIFAANTNWATAATKADVAEAFYAYAGSPGASANPNPPATTEPPKEATPPPATSASKYYMDGSMHVVEIPYQLFKLRYWDKPKKSMPQNGFNVGYFGNYSESGTYFTLPVANLICDITESEIPAVALKYLKEPTRGIKSGKLLWGTDSWGQNGRFSGRPVSTLIVTPNGAKIVKCLRAEQAEPNALYAVSGVPVIVDGKPADWAQDVLAQGWESGVAYATWHGFIGVQPDGKAVYYFGMQTTSGNCITSLEVNNKVSKYGLSGLIKLDGGGSYHLQVGGSVKASTSENRQISNIATF